MKSILDDGLLVFWLGRDVPKRFELILVFLFTAGHKWIIASASSCSTKEEVAGECRKQIASKGNRLDAKLHHA